MTVKKSTTPSATTSPTSGIITTAIGVGNDDAYTAILQPDGKIIAAGWSDNGKDRDFALVRYDSDGSLDTSFDNDGKVTTAIGSGKDWIESIAMQIDGKIIASGTSNNGKDNFALTRYHDNGSLDTSFDGDGKVITAIGTKNDAIKSVTIQTDGRIIAAGWSQNSTNYDFAVVRYNADGSLDLSFDNDGKVTTAIGTSDDAGYDMILQADGKILVAGHSKNKTDKDFALVRYNADGSLDTSFDGDGKVTTAIGTKDDIAWSVIEQSDDKILVAGVSKNGTNDDFALARYNSDGSLDTNFDGDGKVTTAIGLNDDKASGIALQTDGKILVAGYSKNATDNDFALVRYNSNGSLDSDFGNNGKITTAIGSSDEWGLSVFVQKDGKIVVVGNGNNGTDKYNEDFDLVRYNSDGSLDETFNGTVDRIVENTPVSGTLLIKGRAIQGETLSIENNLNDADGLGVFSYQWLQNGKTISGATQETYTLSENDIGKTIKVKVRYTDELGKLESMTSGATEIVDFKVEEIKTPTYTLTVDKTSANENDRVTFRLATTNIAENEEIPVTFGGSISNADVLGGLSTTSFIVEADGTATLPIKFSADKITEGVEILTMMLNDDTTQTVSVTINDTSVPDVPPTKPPSFTSTVVIDGFTLIAKSNANAKLIGSGKNDSLKGLAGADTLRGDAGHDFLDGGLSNDSLEGGNGNDTLIGGEGNDKLLGGSENDKLDGGKGNDTLDGGAGKDVLNGGVGVDSMNGGDGDDAYFVENKNDVVVESNAQMTKGGKDTVTSSAASYTLGENIESLILDDAQGKGNSGKGNKIDNVIIGSIGDNKLEGMEGNDSLSSGEGVDTLDGGLGMDTLMGGSGDDLYIMNNLEDIIIEDVDGGEQDQIVTTVDFNLGQSENVEILTLSGAKAIEGTGNALSNVLQEETGGKTNNRFTGNEGNDTINGEGGNDTLEGGDGDDLLDGGVGEDVAIFMGIYDDYIITSNVDADGVPQLVVEYSNFQNTGILDSRDTLDDIEILQFADGDTHNKSDILKDIGVVEIDSHSALIIVGTML